MRANPSHMKHIRRREDKSTHKFTGRVETFQITFHWTFFYRDSKFLSGRRFTFKPVYHFTP